MYVIDELTKEKVSHYDTIAIAVDHVPGQVIFGYSDTDEQTVPILFYSNYGFNTAHVVLKKFKGKLVYSKKRGMYMSIVDLPKSVELLETRTLGQGSFPYSFAREYEAIDNLDLFKGKQVVLRTGSNQISKYMYYTFGLEFETSMGYIPEDICFRDGLVPLRDGSITGLEYSTVILQGNEGFNLLKQQLTTLREYTTFNKECSLHVHIGGFPLDREALFRLYYLFRNMQDGLESIVPIYTFNSDQYKANGKNYCKKLPPFRDFNNLYYGLVGRHFLGDFTQPHPKDLDRNRKWNIPGRYYALNFINMFCYDVNKTVEFRFLRPTYNYNKILLWLYIFNAMLLVAEHATSTDELNNLTVKSLICRVYPTKLAEALCLGVDTLELTTSMQYDNGDKYGWDISFENKLFKGNLGF